MAACCMPISIVSSMEACYSLFSSRPSLARCSLLMLTLFYFPFLVFMRNSQTVLMVDGSVNGENAFFKIVDGSRRTESDWSTPHQPKKPARHLIDVRFVFLVHLRSTATHRSELHLQRFAVRQCLQRMKLVEYFLRQSTKQLSFVTNGNSTSTSTKTNFGHSCYPK